jgi:hypothetical protein
MRISEPAQVTSWQQDGSNWKENYKQPLLAWLNEMKQDPANAGKLEVFKQSCDRIFSILDSGKPPIKDATAMNDYIHAHFSDLFNYNGMSIYSSQMEPNETYSRLKELLTNLGFKPEQIADLPQASAIQQYKYNLDHVWLPQAGGEEGYDFKGDWQTQGYIRQNIVDPLFSEIDQGHITTVAGARQFVQQHLQNLIDRNIYVNDPYLKSLVDTKDKSKMNAAYQEVRGLYEALGLDPGTAPQPSSGPTPPPSGNTLGVMTLNVRTSDASSPGGDDSIAKDPSRKHYWANRQQPLADEILAQSPAVISLQEATQMQIEGTDKNGDPWDPAHPQVKGLLTLLNENQQPPDRYKVVYLNESKNDDAIIYDSTQMSPIADPKANVSVPLDSKDGFGQRYAHMVALHVGNTGANLIVTDAHAQKMDAGGLTDKDANKIAAALSEMAAEFHNADGTPAKSLFMADSNTSKLIQGSQLQNELEAVKNGGNMKSIYDVFPGAGNTSGLWEPGHGKREDVIFTNAILLSMQQADPTIAAKASDHRFVYGRIQV